MSNPQQITPDPWQTLSQFTAARIALGRAGISLPTRACLDFQLAHALARDAVNIPLDFTELAGRLAANGIGSLTLQSQAENQRLYLQRPDLGRLLSPSSQERLKNHALSPADAVVVVADGLSSTAIAHHAEPFLNLLLPELQNNNYQIPPVCLIKHGRVAVGDAIAEAFAARLCLVLIGERPGLSSPDSMGIYFTYQAKSGLSTDADRNCISNIHHNGLSYAQALKKLLFLIAEAEKLQLSGVNLKDETTETELENLPPSSNFLLTHR
ncbi:MAG: ethanolamine ammonia-lyase subunit EutC [Methylovulum sp.]|uniref:ethanolamine ammonia-lyase subunit EutC n=1 Tax=Methylovulum sp. TaxID=1916980 RepID=UPI0026162A38|nr:ethanolamine ammonia-lyase subunit EutC [Methylovulum sp.]MDD2723897.1 ethanolamine ammonia-lyase subunit EutC [Methylovulum sp.]MDD5126369.1 ethanolamine ammonia-lyase subunit EutC [Methylovulum sp.]